MERMLAKVADCSSMLLCWLLPQMLAMDGGSCASCSMKAPVTKTKEGWVDVKDNLTNPDHLKLITADFPC